MKITKYSMILAAILCMPITANAGVLNDSTPVAASLGDSLLLDKYAELEELVVKGDLPNTRLKGGSMITQVQGTALATSGTAQDMLVKVPGMTGTEDALEVLGKGAPVIYVNGRLMRDMSELVRLRSEDVRDVEVINNPGAKYDASVRAVVRIRTVKHQGDGFGLDFSATSEQDLRYDFNKPSAKLALNYRSNGVDVFGSAWYRHQDYRQYSMLEETTNTHKLFQQTGPYTMTWKNNALVYTAGANWQINDNHSVGARVDLTHYLGGTNQVIFDEDVSEDNVLIDHLYSVQTSDETKPLGWLTNAYYNGTVGKLGIDFNVDFMTSDINTDRENVENSLVRSDLVHSASGSESHLWATKLVFSYPIWKGAFEAGTELTFAKRHNTYSIDKTMIDDTDADIREDNLAAFAEYSCDFGVGGKASLGLRYEHTRFDYDDRIGTDNLHRRMDEFFPSASYTAILGPARMGLSYSVKTNRPDFFAMNDAVTYISRYSLQAGNSQLRNEKLHDLTLNASWRWLMFTATYERCIDAITQWSYIMENDAALIKHINLDKPINIFSAYIGATPHVGLWSLNATVGVAKQDMWLDLDDIHAPGGVRRAYFNKPVYTANAFNTFNFKHNWQVDVNLMFRSKGHQQNFYDDFNNCRLDVVVQKSFLENKALTLRAAVTDILQRNQHNEFGDMGYYQIQQDNRYSLHKLSVSIYYRFNTSRSKYKGTGAGKEAQARMRN